MKRVAMMIAAVCLIAAAAYLLPLAPWTIALGERAREAGAVGVALFIAAYAVSTVLALPGSLLTLAAGFAYGPTWGLAIASPASVGGATLAFILGRSWLRNWAERMAASSPRAQALDAAIGEQGFKLILLLRLSPLFPFNILNYVLSVSKVRLRDYVVASAIGMLPGTALYVYLGSLATTAAELTTARRPAGASLWLYAAGLVATVVVAVVVTRAARSALKLQIKDAP